MNRKPSEMLNSELFPPPAHVAGSPELLEVWNRRCISKTADGVVIKEGVEVWFWNFNINGPMVGRCAENPEYPGLGLCTRMNNDLSTDVYLDTLGPKWHSIKNIYAKKENCKR